MTPELFAALAGAAFLYVMNEPFIACLGAAVAVLGFLNVLRLAIDRWTR